MEEVVQIKGKALRSIIQKARGKPGTAYYIKRKGINVYKVICNNFWDIKLYHYNKLILTIEYPDVELGEAAYSASDRDAINVALEMFGMSNEHKARIKNFSLGLVEVKHESRT